MIFFFLGESESLISARLRSRLARRPPAGLLSSARDPGSAAPDPAPPPLDSVTAPAAAAATSTDGESLAAKMSSAISPILRAVVSSAEVVGVAWLLLSVGLLLTKLRLGCRLWDLVLPKDFLPFEFYPALN